MAHADRVDFSYRDHGHISLRFSSVIADLQVSVRSLWLGIHPYGSTVPIYEIHMDSTRGIVIMILGIYSVFGYLDP